MIFIDTIEYSSQTAAVFTLQLCVFSNLFLYLRSIKFSLQVMFLTILCN